MFKTKLLLSLLGLLCFLPLGYSIDTIRVTSLTSSKTFFRLVRNQIEVFPDESGKLSFEEVKDKSFRTVSKKEQNERGEYLYGEKTGCLWVRFVFYNKSKQDKLWLIEFLDFNTKNIQLYIPDEHGNYTKASSGFSYPFYNREVIHKNFDFNIPYSQKPLVCYARIEPGSSSVLSVDIKSYKGFITYSINEYYLLGLFYGIILIMGIYNLILYVNIGEKHYLFYVFYVICVGLASMCHDGTGFQYLWPNYPNWNQHILVSSLFGLVLWTLFYSKWYLNTRLNAPATDKVILYLIVATLVLLIAVELFRPAHMAYLIPVASIPFILIYITAIKIFLKGYQPARFFLMAFTFFLLGYSIRLLSYFNIIENNIFSIYSYNIGVLTEMILFSIAIGDRIRTLKEERTKALLEKDKAQHQIILQLKENEKLKDKVNRELEEKVALRTQEINHKNQELEKANEQLKILTDKVNEWNIKLDLDNRKLQGNVKELEQARIMLKDVKFDEFSTIFPNENTCLKYLAELKWKESYQCKKCGNTNFGKSKSLYGKRCTKCNYDESPTNDTLFHRLRFPITKAFYMVYLVSIKDKNITVDELSKILSLRRETCWSFKRKIMMARKNAKKAGKSADNEGWASLALISID